MEQSSKSTQITRSRVERSDLHHAHGDLDDPPAMNANSYRNKSYHHSAAL
jgi:hypothetical protein